MLGLQIDVNSRVPVINAWMYGKLQIRFTFPIAVTVVFSLRLSSEHPKLSLSSSSACTICSRSRELDILTNTFALLGSVSQTATIAAKVTGVTSHVNNQPDHNG